jgi:hypothetical protein
VEQWTFLHQREIHQALDGPTKAMKRLEFANRQEQS